jgi:hypothetical protein
VWAGEGDGSTTAFILPSYAATSRTLYANGSAVTEAAYTATRARASNVATLTTQSAHGFSVGNSITVVGVGGSGYNATATVASIPNRTTLTYANTGGNEAQTADTAGYIWNSARWRFSASGAPDGRRDLGTFWTAPTDGHYLHFTFTGRRAFNARLLSDAWSASSFARHLTKSGLEIQEVDG